MNTPQHHRTRRGGQALIELTIALVCLLALCAGLLQIAVVTKAQTDALFTARQESSRGMFSDHPPWHDPQFIGFWDAGPDNKPMTADDRARAGNGSQFAATVVEKTVADPAHWPVISDAPDPAFFALRGNPDPAREFGLLGASETRTAELLPAVRHLLYNADAIACRAEVWMTWTRGMY